MALEYPQMTELENLKQKHKIEIFKEQDRLLQREHDLKMKRLEKHLEIAKVEAGPALVKRKKDTISRTRFGGEE